jgi:iron complex outermembrane receptor protein
MYNNVYSNLGAARNVYNIANIVNNASVNFLETGFSNNQYLSDYYLSNASFIRMDNAFIGYSLGQIRNTGARANLSATVQNVFVITKYKGLDPEIGGGIDNSFYPRPRVFTLGLNVNF